MDSNLLALAWAPERAPFLLNGKSYEWQPGRVFLLQGRQRLRFDRIPKGLQLVVFEDWLLREFLSTQPEAAALPLFHPLGAYRYTDVREQSAIAMEGLAQLMKTLHSFKLLNDYLQLLLKHIVEAATPLAGILPPGQLAELLTLIAKSYKNERSLGFYATKLGLDAGYLNRLAKRRLGFTVEQLVSRQLLSEAQRLLGFSGLQVKRIASDLCFNSTAAFSVFFKRGTGSSPQAFRQQLGAKIF